MAGSRPEILVRREQWQTVPNAQLSDQGIDRPDLNALAAASIPQRGRFNMVLGIGCDHRKHGEILDDCPFRFGSLEALEQFLQNDTGRHDKIALLEVRLK